MKNRLGLLLCLVGIAGASALGQGKSTKTPNLTPAERTQMADVHEKFAACLRSTRPLSECHSEMAKACHDSSGTLCLTMGGMGMDHHCPMSQQGQTK